MATIKVESNILVSVPNGTKIIRNDGEFITLMRKLRGGNVLLFTSDSESINSIDLNNESNWNEFTKDEMIKINSYI